MKKFFTIISVFLLSITSFGQNWGVDYYTSARMGVTGGEYMPFWARTGQNGILPVVSSGLVEAGADISWNSPNGWFFEAGTNLVGVVAKSNPLMSGHVDGIVDRLYLSGGWKMLRLDVGLLPRKNELGDLSISGGDFSYSNNARNLPGINLSTDWIYFEKGHWVGIKGNLAHYQMIDNRYVKNTLLHNKSLAIKFALGRNVDFIAGLEHWAQWGGDSPLYGPQPESFNDFLKVFFAQGGGEDASISDQVNVLGNHLGREWVRVDWRARKFTMTFQYDKPFEDGSGTRLQNFPDGIWSLKFSMKDRDAFVTDVIGEFIYTCWQSGPEHDRPATEEEMAKQDPNDFYYGKVVLGGCDNYFSNGAYGSCWTFYNRVIGMPLIIPSAPNKDGITIGMMSTRVRAYHIGLAGVAFKKVPYVMKATYSKNFGNYKQSTTSPFYDAPRQLSLALEAEIGERLIDWPVKFNVGVYGDIGELYQNSVGLTLKINYTGGFKF